MSALNHIPALIDQTKLLRMIVAGSPLLETLESLARMIEQKSSSLSCGICVFDRGRRVVANSIGQSLPKKYVAGLMDFPLSQPFLAPCATVAHEGQAVDVPDIGSDERYPLKPWRELALEHGLKSCRSTPIVDSQGNVCATFVLYSKSANDAECLNAALAETAADLASIAIESENKEIIRKENEDRLRFAIEGAGIGTWDYNAQTNRVSLSERCCKLLGIQNDKDLTLDDVLHALHPDDRERTQGVIQAALDENGPYEVEHRVIWPDGSTHWVHVKGRVFLDHGEAFRSIRGVATDITESKQSHQDAEENAARFQLLAESLPHKIFTATPAGEMEYLNEEWAYYTDLSVNEVLERGWREFVHPDDIEKKRRLWNKAMETATPFELEHRFWCRDGTYRWHLTRAYPLKDTEGNVLLWIGSNTDIDVLKRSQVKLQESESRFRNMADATPVLVWMADVSKNCIYFNKRWLAFTGRTMQEEYGDGWLQGVHDEDLDHCLATYQTAFDRREPFSMEYRLRRSDGEYRWFLDSGSPLHAPDGAFIGFIGGCMDIQEHKELEQRLREAESCIRLAVEAAGMGFWDWTVGGSVKWSSEHNRILGLDPDLSEGSYESFLQNVHPGDQTRVVLAIEKALKSCEDYSTEFRIEHPERGARWIATHGRSFCDEAGNVTRMLGIVRDVTSSKHYEDQMRSHQEELRSALDGVKIAHDEALAASSAKDQFLAVLSHELRTPLTPVLMAVATLRADKNNTQETLSALDMIQRNVRMEARLIDDLLDLTRVVRNKLEIEKVPVDVHEVVRSALEVCLSEIDHKALMVEMDLSAPRHEILGDAVRLQQVFWNLMQNAVKFTSESGLLRIRSFNRELTLVVEVEDTGIGISEELLPRIFEPFEQGASQYMRQFGGLGLGLAISKAAIDAHGGEVIATSAGEGKGAIFRVELPVHHSTSA